LCGGLGERKADEKQAEHKFQKVMHGDRVVGEPARVKGDDGEPLSPNEGNGRVLNH